MQHTHLADQFSAHIAKNRLFRIEDIVLLAVSGGVDSVVMVHLMKQCGFRFGIAHCNFQLRGDASDTDTVFVKTLAEELDVPFFMKRFDTLTYKKDSGLSLEEAARKLRYTWFEEIRTAFGYTVIATAHHINDSIETILLNMVKGTGLKGLSGIRVRNRYIVRPLLFASGADIQAYAKENALQFRTDSSNSESIFQRNKIRNLVIPVLKEINPALEKTFTKNMVHFQDAALIVQETMDKKIKKLLTYRRDAVYVPIHALKNLPASASYLYEIVRSFGFSEEQSIQIHENLSGSGKQFFSAHFRVIIDRRFLIIAARDAAEAKYMLIDKTDSAISTAYFKLTFRYSAISGPVTINTKGTVAYFDADTITFPLTLRIWKKGDYLYPLGLYKKNSKKDPATGEILQNRPAKKKVSDMLTDLKMDLHAKENVFVLLSDEKIIWLTGIRQDERFKIKNATKRLLKISMTDISDA